MKHLHGPLQDYVFQVLCSLLQAMDNVHMSSGPPTPQQGDPFAPSYMHPSGNSSHTLPSSDPFSQASSAQPPYGQPPSGQAQYDQTTFGQSSFGQPSFGQPLDNQPSFGQSSAGQLPSGQSSFGQSSFGQPSFGQAAQMSQQQAPGQGGSASHNPFAASAGAFGGSSVSAGVQHITMYSCKHWLNFTVLTVLHFACLLCGGVASHVLPCPVNSTSASCSDQLLQPATKKYTGNLPCH